MSLLNANPMRTLLITTSLCAVTFLSGCTSLSSLVPDPAPANTVFRLSASTQDTVVTPTHNAIILRVDRPSVPRPLSGNDITVSPSGDRILSAAGAEWAEKVPDLIQGSIMDVFSSRPNIIGVLPVSGARTELRIHLNVRNFEAIYDQGEGNAPLAVVRYTATLANASNRNLIGSFDIRSTQRAADNRISEIVRAQDMANAAAINGIADWVIEMSPKVGS
jgi:cholesterol transport system auxiliary component